MHCNIRKLESLFSVFKLVSLCKIHVFLTLTLKRFTVWCCVQMTTSQGSQVTTLTEQNRKLGRDQAELIRRTHQAESNLRQKQAECNSLIHQLNALGEKHNAALRSNQCLVEVTVVRWNHGASWSSNAHLNSGWNTCSEMQYHVLCCVMRISSQGRWWNFFLQMLNTLFTNRKALQSFHRSRLSTTIPAGMTRLPEFNGDKTSFTY